MKCDGIIKRDVIRDRGKGVDWWIGSKMGVFFGLVAPTGSDGVEVKRKKCLWNEGGKRTKLDSWAQRCTAVRAGVREIF